MKSQNIIKLFCSLVTLSIIIYSCASVDQAVQEKSGAVLWGENCIRCHISPSPTNFSDEQWKTLLLHMQVRANLTSDEANKIADFMKSAN